MLFIYYYIFYSASSTNGPRQLPPSFTPDPKVDRAFKQKRTKSSNYGNQISNKTSVIALTELNCPICNSYCFAHNHTTYNSQYCRERRVSCSKNEINLNGQSSNQLLPSRLKYISLWPRQ